MNLGVFLSSGESIESLRRLGQDKRLAVYLHAYARQFKKVYLFSYKHDDYGNFPLNVTLLSLPFLFHRYLSMFLLPLFHWRKMRQCDVLRVTQFPGVIPAIIGKVLFQSHVLVTYGFSYEQFALLDRAYMQRFLLFFLEKCTFPFIDTFLVTTRVIARALMEKGVRPEKIVMIPNGVETKVFSPARKQKRCRQQKTILFIGRLEPQKNVLLLVHVVSILSRELRVFLKIIGSGSLQQQIEKELKKQGIKCSIHPFISYADLPAVYQSADIFVLPSHIEGHPKVLLEAMSCGLPCIVTSYPGADEIISHGKNGFIVRPTVNQLLRAMRVLARSEKKRQQIGQAARKRMQQAFRLEQLLAKEVSVLKKLGSA